MKANTHLKLSLNDNKDNFIRISHWAIYIWANEKLVTKNYNS